MSHLETSTGLGLRVRPMTDSDLDAVQAIEMRVHSHPWQPRSFVDCLKSGHLAFVAEQVGSRESQIAIAAYALASVGGGQADLLNIAVAPELRRNGIAQALLLYLTEQIRGRADTLFLEVRISNDPAIQLYEKLGFNQVGSRPNYYPAVGGREDALILALELPG
ncbi:ribosomal protein S18-alanine N-acetyltransferase [Gilvimarinus sp. F26214L]|uniref:ribosomal protein S18-alanine N-acetyltransferase n=1 Tax=Gilvimarinus sp. DZF01 TaxID=3461371 RepID=UPI004045C741